MKKLIKIFALSSLTFFVIAFFSSLPAISSSDLDDLNREQDRINNQIKQTEQKITQVNKERALTLSELKKINDNISRTRKEIDKLDSSLEVTQKYIEDVQIDIDIKEEELNERTDVFETRLSQMYKTGEISFLEVLFQSASITDFLTRFEYFQRLAKNDTELLRELEEARAELESKKKQLETKEAELLNLKEQNEAKKKQLETESNERASLVKQIEQEKDALTKILDDLESESERITLEIMKLQSKSGTRPSSLLWPTPGHKRITSQYGNRIHPILKVRRMHTGIDIAAPYGHKIIAAAGGTVLDAGYRTAYGNTVIIDHGGGMTTLYAHLSEFNVRSGSTVAAGATIGKIGTTGWSTGPHLHFEVRLNGQHVNPLSYL